MTETRQGPRPVAGGHKGTWVLTFTGRRVHLLDPDPESITLGDVARALALQNRFCGHTYEPMSVAKHSVAVSELAAAYARAAGMADEYVESVAIQGLLHDATEAYTGDCVAPLKRLLPAFGDIESAVWETMARKWRVPSKLYPEVERADLAMLRVEMVEMMGAQLHAGDFVATIPRCELAQQLVPLVRRDWGWRGDHAAFLARAEELGIR
jgi:hypothetical protein